jgi:uncharacterized membrane protein YraQ (UPF0718 family)
VPGYFSKLLLRNASLRHWWRKVRAVGLWLILGVVIVALVAGLLYLIYSQPRP